MIVLAIPVARWLGLVTAHRSVTSWLNGVRATQHCAVCWYVAYYSTRDCSTERDAQFVAVVSLVCSLLVCSSAQICQWPRHLGNAARTDLKDVQNLVPRSLLWGVIECLLPGARFVPGTTQFLLWPTYIE
jgi:hypothetical protein